MYKKLLIWATLIAGLLSIGQQFMILDREVQAQEEGTLEKFGKDLDNAGRQYNEGVAVGKADGFNGENNDCQSDNSVYCLGYSTGYGIGERARGVQQEVDN